MEATRDLRGNECPDVGEYYLSLNDKDVRDAFCNLDRPSVLNSMIQLAQNDRAENFLVDFSDSSAWAAFDLPSQSLTTLLATERPEEIGTRWLNIFCPYHHRSLLEYLAQRYDFSPRLLALMSSEPSRAGGVSSPKYGVQSAPDQAWKSPYMTEADTEAQLQPDEISERLSTSNDTSVASGNLYKIVNDIWHYSSVDFGRQYICIGFNSLYGTKTAEYESERLDTPTSRLPDCVRVWTWLILCEDQTVISVHENPFPFSRGHLSSFQLQVLGNIRGNIVNVFQSLSRVHDDSLLSRNPMTLLPIRTRLGTTPEETAHRESDAPGLLLYYLFENWHNSYTLVTRKESRYGVELEGLRREMLEQPKLVHIDRLDSIGRELGILKRHYESYNRIVDRLLEPQRATLASLQNSQILTTASQVSLDTVRPFVMEQESMMGVSLSSAARVRFKRLKDLIDLYALSEVEAYVKQKEALVAMNFHLIAIKQSLDVDRLTRVTLLLTKTTILFLPVSLMTGYFSTELTGVEFTLRTYWIAFAVIIVASWLALFLFGVLNGNVQTLDILKSFWGAAKTGYNAVIRKTKKHLAGVL